MSLVRRENSLKMDKVAIVREKHEPKKVLEEEEYLGRMAKIIKRDFFSTGGSSDFGMTPNSFDPEQSNRTYYETPGTSRTNLSTTSSIKSRQEACSMRLNEFLEKYTSEDNAYFERLQRKELQRHRVKFPWLYTDRDDHNKHTKEQLKLPSIHEQFSSDHSKIIPATMIGWPYNPRNSLFYPPSDIDRTKRQHQSTVNPRSSKYMKEPIFKEPLSHRGDLTRQKKFNRFTDKIGIDGKLLNGLETPSMNGYSYVPPPETPRIIDDQPKLKSETSRFYIPNESPRDNLAHKVYQEKVAKNIRTPKTDTTRTSKKTQIQLF